jgi:hypothetical protein
MMVYTGAKLACGAECSFNIGNVPEGLCHLTDETGLQQEISFQGGSSSQQPEQYDTRRLLSKVCFLFFIYINEGRIHFKV